jgi:tape measure domain-containing protein
VTDTAAALVIAMSLELKAFRAEMRNATGLFDTEARKIERRQAQMRKKLEQSFSFGGMKGALAGVGVGLSAREIIRYGDAWTAASNRIRASGTAFDSTHDRMASLADLSVKTRSTFEQTVNAFSRLRMFTPNMGEDRASRIVETMNKAFVVGGASGSERGAATLQLTQALSSGMLQGDELRSIRETAPLIAQSIADIMGTTIGGLKQLGAEGKLTTDVILKAIEAAAPKIDALYSKTQVTVSDALNNLETRFTQFVGKMSEAGAFSTIADAITGVSDNLEDIVKWAGVATAALGPMALAGAARGAATAFGVLAGAIMANPLLTLATVVAAAAAALWIYKDKIDKTAASVNSAREAHEKLNKLLDEAKKNSGQAASDKVQEAKSHLLAAQAKLKEAEAQAELNLRRAEGAQQSRMTPGSASPTAFGVSDFYTPDKYQKALVDIHAAQACNVADLKSLSAVKSVDVPSVSITKPTIGTKTAKKLSEVITEEEEIRAGYDVVTHLNKAIIENIELRRDLEDLANKPGLSMSDDMQKSVDIADNFRETMADIVVNFDNAKGALASFLQMLAKMAAMEGVEAIFGKSGTSIGGGEGGDSSGSSGLISAAWGGVKSIPGFANGTNSTPGGSVLIGERGPEIVDLPRGSRVTPSAPSMAMLRGGGAKNSYVNNGGNIIVAGDTDNRSLRMMQALLEQQDAKYESQWLATNQKYNRNK